jgi:hypothetical protein
MAEPARFGPIWSSCLPLLSVTTLLCSPAERRLPAALIAALAYMFAQFVLPGSRLRKDYYFSPVNVALLLFAIKLVAVPALIATTGPGAKLPVTAVLPPWSAMDRTLYIDTAAFLAFSLGLEAISRRRRRKAVFLQAALSQTPSPAYIAVFVVIGLIGFAAVFDGDPSLLLHYFTDHSVAAAVFEDNQQNVKGVIGTLFRPFLAFALAAWWARVVDRDRDNPKPWKAAAAGLIAALGITMANMTYSFNRAAFVFPVVCLLAVYSARVRRIPLTFAGLALVCVLPALLAVGAYRSMTDDEDIAGALEKSMQGVSEQIQIYSGGPQLTGHFYESIRWGDQLYLGSTLFNSVLTPIPVLGKGSRDTCGPAVYNYAIYGTREIEDQIIPFDVELFANFHVPGVLFGFAGLGIFLGWAEQCFEAARSVFGAFAVQYVALWAAMLSIWSLSVFVQICWMFFWSVYLYVASVQARRWLTRSDRARPATFCEHPL